jgi:hypothetical protein
MAVTQKPDSSPALTADELSIAAVLGFPGKGRVDWKIGRAHV